MEQGGVCVFLAMGNGMGFGVLNYRRHQWKSRIFPPISWRGIFGNR